MLLGLLFFGFELYYLEVSRRVEDAVVGEVSCVEEFVDQELDLLVGKSVDFNDSLVLGYLPRGHRCHVFNQGSDLVVMKVIGDDPGQPAHPIVKDIVKLHLLIPIG